MFLIDVVDVTPMDGHQLELTFKDGLKAVVDVDRIIQRFDGVFAPSRTPITSVWSASIRRSGQSCGPTGPTCARMCSIPMHPGNRLS